MMNPTKAMQIEQQDALVMKDIKGLWDAEGFGSDDAVSEPLYNRLGAAIEQLENRWK